MTEIVKSFTDFVNESEQPSSKVLLVLKELIEIIQNNSDSRIDSVDINESTNDIQFFYGNRVGDSLELSVNGDILERVYAEYFATVALKVLDEDLNISNDELSLITNSEIIPDKFIQTGGLNIYGIEIKTNIEYSDKDYPNWEYSSNDDDLIFYSLDELNLTEDSEIEEFGIAISDLVNELFDQMEVDARVLQGWLYLTNIIQNCVQSIDVKLHLIKKNMKPRIDGSKKLTKKDRILIYKRALDYYKSCGIVKYWKTGELFCEGMCIALRTTTVLLAGGRTTEHTALCAENFPEYYSYAPKRY